VAGSQLWTVQALPGVPVGQAFGAALAQVPAWQAPMAQRSAAVHPVPSASGTTRQTLSAPGLHTAFMQGSLDTKAQSASAWQLTSGWQAPVTQACPAGQALPQVPQLAGS
jgi:hypothetical protein